MYVYIYIHVSQWLSNINLCNGSYYHYLLEHPSSKAIWPLRASSTAMASGPNM